MFKYASLTKQGMALIAQATNLKRFIFTRMEYGDGVPEGFSASKTSDEIKAILCEMTSLVSKKADIGMYNINVKNNCATLVGKIISSSLTEDFFAKELGVYAKIDDGSDVLVAYFVSDDKPDPINQAALVGQEHKVVVDVAVGNAANITIEYSDGVYVTQWEFNAFEQQNADEHTALQQSITALEASVDEKIGSIDISALLSHIKQYDHVVDSNETLLAWANCTDGSMKSVLVKSGEYTLNGKMINLANAGTKFVFAEPGNKITVSNYMRGIGATEDYGAVIVGLNVEVSFKAYDNFSSFYRGMICYNCTGTSNGTGTGYGFYNCTCYNCIGTSTSTGYSYGFDGCTCSNCTGSGTSTNGSYGYGFYSCTCSNCTGTGTGKDGIGFYSCTCSNCTGTGTSTSTGSGSGSGFNGCTCSNCTGTGTGTSTGSGFYSCTCSNCTGTGTSTNGGYSYGFYNCTCSNCTGTGTGKDGTGYGYGFYGCKHCSSCHSGGAANTTATWGGTNTYIDSDSCNYVAA